MLFAFRVPFLTSTLPGVGSSFFFSFHPPSRRICSLYPIPDARKGGVYAMVAKRWVPRIQGDQVDFDDPLTTRDVYLISFSYNGKEGRTHSNARQLVAAVFADPSTSVGWIYSRARTFQFSASGVSPAPPLVGVDCLAGLGFPQCSGGGAVRLASALIRSTGRHARPTFLWHIRRSVLFPIPGV